MGLRTKTAQGMLVYMAIFTNTFAGALDIESANNKIGAQVLYKHINHTETENGAALDSEDGHVMGYGLTGSVMRDWWLGHDYLAVQYSSFSGETSYTGCTMGNPAYGSLRGKSKAQIKDGDLRYGKGFVADDDAIVTLYLELGYHKYDRYLGYGTPDGYRETYTHNYYGVGALGQYSAINKIVFSAYFLNGRTYGANIVVALPSPYAGFSAKLGNSALYKVGVSVDYAFTINFHANLSVDTASWNYGKSQNQSIGNGLYAYEPDSTTKDTTAKISIGYAF